MKSSFESTLWDEVRQAVRDDPNLRFWGHFNWWFRAKPWPYWLKRPCNSFWVMIIVRGILGQGAPYDNGPALFLYFANFWIFTGVLGLAFCLATLRQSDPGRHFLQHLPISSSALLRRAFNWVWQELLVGPLDLVIAFSVLAHVLDFSWSGYLGLLLLIPLNRLYTFSMAMFIGLRLPQQVWAFYLVAIFWIAVLVLQFMPAEIHAVENLLLPTAYPLALIWLCEPDPNWIFLLYLIPISLVIFTLPDSFKRLQKRFDYSVDEPKPAEESVSEKEGPSPVLQNGPVERALWKWFTPREKRLAPFLFPNDLDLTWSWVVINVVFFILLPIVILLLRFDLSFGNPLLGMGETFSMIVSCCALAAGIAKNLFNLGPIGRIIHFSGASLHLFCPYPITYSEMVRQLMKSTLIQLPLFAPICLTTTVVIAYCLDQSPYIATIKGFELCISLMGTRLFLLPMGINTAMRLNLYWYYWYKYIFYFMMGAAWACGALFIGVFGLIAPFIIWHNEPESIALSLLSPALGYISILLNCAAYGSRMCDLVAQVRTSTIRLLPNQLPWERTNL